MGYYEYSAAPGSSVDDIEGWKHANPALGYTINIQNIKDAAIFDSPDAFKTETLCMWTDAIDSPWPIQIWNDSEQEIALEDGLPTSGL